MRKQFLWVRSPGLHYLAPGNIDVSAGSQGTLSFWYHPGAKLPQSNVLWRLEIDADNYSSVRWESQSQGRMFFVVRSNGVSKYVELDNLLPDFVHEWWLITATWDFTTPDAGVLHLYVNDRVEDTPVSDANGSGGSPVKLHVGGEIGTNNYGCCIDNFVIYDGAMTHDQHNARRGPADSSASLQNARRKAPHSDECGGELLFWAGFNGSYDATIASGDATAYFDASEADYDKFARLDDGSRYKGRRLLLPLGTPRHDLSCDDRLPGEAVLGRFSQYGIGAYTIVENDDDCSRIVISQAPSETVGEGRTWLWPWLQAGDLVQPFTVRMRVNMPESTNPNKYWTNLGPLVYYNGGAHGGVFGDWGTGDQLEVVADAGNSASSFKTDLGSQSDNYWVGAELSVISGNCAPARLKVSGYNNTTKFITVAGALSGVPDAESVCIVDFRGRLCAFDEGTVLEDQSMEAWLWEEYGGDRPWIELECQQADDGTNPIVRYDRGRAGYMEFVNTAASSTATSGLMFGKNGSIGPNVGYSAEIRLESLEIDGPGSYQVLGAHESRYGSAYSPSDTFMVRDPETLLSSRIWRCEGVERHVERPTKYATPAEARSDLEAAGTWRDTCSVLSVVYPRSAEGEVTCLVLGTDTEDTRRLGYLTGTFDGSRMSWVEETPPEGKSNPFMAHDSLLPTARSDSDWGSNEYSGVVSAFGLDDGTWALTYEGSEDNPDHYMTRVLHGAADRWSFSYDEHYWPQNPICPGTGGVTKLTPEYAGVTQWGNRDAEWVFAYDADTPNASERFVGYCRGKTIMPLVDIGTNMRMVLGVTSPDLKSFRPLPHGNVPSPLAARRMHVCRAFCNGPDTMCHMVEYYGEGLRLMVSDDKLHFAQLDRYFIPGEELPGEPSSLYPGCSFRIGDYRVYYYSGLDFLNYAYIKRNRETYYDLESGSLSGVIETAVVEKPLVAGTAEAAWNDLYVNAAPQDGQLRVEVVDPTDEQVVAGYSADDCDSIPDSVEELVTWGGASLTDLTQENLRLLFYLDRDVAEDESPQLFAWSVSQTPRESAPSASNPRTDGKLNPAGVTNPNPELSWDYSDPFESPQSAYHLLVASTQELLDANNGDLWDSGPAISSESSATYAGEALDELTTYFWKVRVRNEEGEWSEEW